MKNLAGPAAARSRIASSSAGVASVLFATTRMRGQPGRPLLPASLADWDLVDPRHGQVDDQCQDRAEEMKLVTVVPRPRPPSALACDM